MSRVRKWIANGPAVSEGSQQRDFLIMILRLSDSDSCFLIMILDSSILICHLIL